MELMDYWKDFAALNRTIVFDRAMIVSRETTGRQYVLFSSFLLYYLIHLNPSPLSGKWFKMISPTLIISPPSDFFEPIRRMALTSLLGYLPIVSVQGAVVSLAASHHNNTNHNVQSDLPVVTYISRQGGGRRLDDADHEGLVQALRELENEGVCKVNVVKMQTLGVRGQVEIVARSTVGTLLFSFCRGLMLLFLLFCGSTGIGWCSWKWNDCEQLVLFHRDLVIFTYV